MIQTAIDEDEYRLPFNVKEVMKSWITKKGYPIVHVSRNYTTNMVQIEQKRFSWFNIPAEEKNETWLIPINFASENLLDFNKTIPDIWLKDSVINVPVKAESEDWMIINKQQTGIIIFFFYRFI